MPTSSPAPRRWLLPAVVLLGVALQLPSLRMGFFVDDYSHQLALEGGMPLRPWSLFDFGEVADWRPFEDRFWGFPWWTSPDWKIRFFRPLSSLLLAFDHALWGGSPLPYHVTSLLWFAALLLSAYAAYRALDLSRGVATAGVALLAVSQATVLPVAWIANRNSLHAACFTALAVACAAWWGRSGRRRALVLAFASAALACLAKESGVVAFAAVAAVLLVRRAPAEDAGRAAARPGTRAAALAAVACGAAYVAGLAVAGFGTRSLFYATPWSDPLRYASNAVRLLTIGSLSLFTPLPADAVFAWPGAAGALTAVSALLLVPIGLWGWKRLRGDRAAAALLLWTLLALAPEGGAPLQDRLLLGANLGAAGLLAMLLARTVPRSAGRGRWERAAAWSLVVLAGGLEAVVTCGRSALLADGADDVRQKVLAADIGAPETGRRQVLVLQADDPLVAFGIGGTWAFETRDEDLAISLLQTGRRGLRWTREDERTMVFESTGRPFVEEAFETVYRSTTEGLAPGAKFHTPMFDAEVLDAAPGGGVTRLRLRFAEGPAGDRFRFLAPRDGRMTHVPPPAPGETVELPSPPPGKYSMTQ